MLNVRQFRYGADNFAYIIHGKTQAMVIDGGAWKELLSFLKTNNLILKYITNTHSHYDHTLGNDYLLEATGARFLNSGDLLDNHNITIDGENIIVYKTPGHTADSVCFHTGNTLITGDTIFNGTVGNCFSGNLKNFYLTIRRLMALPDETIIYAGHDYIHDALVFAKHLEPNNEHIDSFLKSYNRNHVYSTMTDERRINPYLRFNEETIVNIIRENKLPYLSEWERWNSLMSIE